MSNCPKCKQSPRNGEPMVCDNDCGTILCEFCKREYFVDEIGKIRLGHAAWCGEDNNSSDFVSDNDSESESYDSYDSSDGDRESYDSRESEDSNGGAYSSSRDSESYSYETSGSYDSDSYDSDTGDYSSESE
jgi:hypothetical protein